MSFVAHGTPEHRLMAEIAWYEARLRELGESAESAYEKALTRSFEQALATHRARLAAIHGPHQTR